MNRVDVESAVIAMGDVAVCIKMVDDATEEGNAVQQGQDSRSADVQRMMRQIEQGLGEEASQAVKKLGNAQQLEGMLKGLSDKDMARLENLMKHPERLRSLLTPENLQKLKDTLGG